MAPVPKPLCEFAGCDRPQRNRGLCNAHAMQRKRGTKLRPLGKVGWKSKGRQKCEFYGCGRFNHNGGLCNTHDMQRRRGVPLRAIRPPKPVAEEGMLWCGTCRQFRDEDEFGWDRTRNQPARICRPCHADEQVAYRDANKDRVNLQVRLRKRGLTEDRYRELLELQQGRCAICDKQRPLDIDHCHKRGHVRALLCGLCNRGLGFFDDDPVIIEQALEYLRTHE